MKILYPELFLRVNSCDSDQVNTSTNVTRTLKNTHLCLQQEPDILEHLLHLPRTWPSNQCACVKKLRIVEETNGSD